MRLLPCCRPRSALMQTGRQRRQLARRGWGSGCGMRGQGTTTMRCTDGTTTSRRVGIAGRRAGTLGSLLCGGGSASQVEELCGAVLPTGPIHLPQAPAAACSADMGRASYLPPACAGMYYGGEPVVWTDKPSLPQEARYEVMNKPPPVPASAAAATAGSSGTTAGAAARQPAAAGARPAAAGQQYAVAGSRIKSSHPMSQVGGLGSPVRQTYASLN